MLLEPLPVAVRLQQHYLLQHHDEEGVVHPCTM
jgi:hypothetical protein